MSNFPIKFSFALFDGESGELELRPSYKRIKIRIQARLVMALSSLTRQKKKVVAAALRG
jgi:hypothetical protein